MNLDPERPDLLMARIQHAQAVNGYRQMKKQNIHPKQIPIIFTLKDHEGISQNELAKMLHVKPPTIAVSVKRLSAAGFIIKEDDQKDARISHLYLTESAQRVIEETTNTFEHSADKMLAGFTETERAQFVGYLKRILENVAQLDDTCDETAKCDFFEEDNEAETDCGEET